MPYIKLKHIRDQFAFSIRKSNVTKWRCFSIVLEISYKTRRIK